MINKSGLLIFGGKAIGTTRIRRCRRASILPAVRDELRTSGATCRIMLTMKGKGGGCRLAQPAAKIMVGNIARILDGPLAPIPCANRTACRRCDDCRDPTLCEAPLAMTEARDATAAVLDRNSLADMCNARTTPAGLGGAGPHSDRRRKDFLPPPVRGGYIVY